MATYRDECAGMYASEGYILTLIVIDKEILVSKTKQIKKTKDLIRK